MTITPPKEVDPPFPTSEELRNTPAKIIIAPITETRMPIIVMR
jgi:hypothetical protein